MIHQFSCLEKILLRLNIIPHPFIDALANIVVGRALQASVKLGLMDTLAAGPQSARRLAEQTGMHEEGVQLLLHSLEALGYVQQQSNGYGLSARGSTFFAKDAPSGLHQMVLFADHVFTVCADLEACLTMAVPAPAGYAGFPSELWETFTGAMFELARINAAHVTKRLPVPRQARKLLDLGGSHGLYSIELCKRFPHLSAEILDFAAVAPVAQQLLREHQLTDRITFRPGNFMQEELGSDYDVVLVFNIMHGLSHEANQHLASKVRQALKPGGLYAMLDQIHGTEGKTQLHRLTAAATALIFFQQLGGRRYTLHDVSTWLQGAGFRRWKVRKTRTPGMALILAEP